MELSSPRLNDKQILATELKVYWKVRDKIEYTVIYTAVILLLSAGICLVLSIDFVAAFTLDRIRIIAAIAFFVLGAAHMIAFPRLIKQSADYEQNGFGYSILLGVLVSAITFLSQQLQGRNDYKFTVIAVCAFLIPYAILQSILNFIVLTPKELPVWTLPASEPVEDLASFTDRNISFTIKIKVKFIDNDETPFSFITSRHLPLGVVFSQFIKENASVRTTNPSKEQYGWKFTRINFLGKKELDPALDLVSNGIEDKSTVLIERIRF